MGIKITASRERLFRLRLAALNDTICLLRAFVSFESLCPWYLQCRGHFFQLVTNYHRFADVNKTSKDII